VGKITHIADWSRAFRSNSHDLRTRGPVQELDHAALIGVRRGLHLLATSVTVRRPDLSRERPVASATVSLVARSRASAAASDTIALDSSAAPCSRRHPRLRPTAPV